MADQRPNLPGQGQPVEDYTVPFLVVAGVLCWIGLFVIWIIWGFLGALATAFAADKVIARKS